MKYAIPLLVVVILLEVKNNHTGPWNMQFPFQQVIQRPYEEWRRLFTMNPFSQMKLLKFLHLLLHVIFGEEKAFWSGEKDSKLDPHE